MSQAHEAEQNLLSFFVLQKSLSLVMAAVLLCSNHVPVLLHFSFFSLNLLASHNRAIIGVSGVSQLLSQRFSANFRMK